jgi:hypothetical protein
MKILIHASLICISKRLRLQNFEMNYETIKKKSFEQENPLENFIPLSPDAKGSRER